MGTDAEGARSPSADGGGVGGRADNPTPRRKTVTAQGRNTPCHCASGRKYKNCHLRRDREQETLVATAMHESRHVIATCHYGFSIGDAGVFITDQGSGFTDSNKKEKWGERRIKDI